MRTDVRKSALVLMLLASVAPQLHAQKLESFRGVDIRTNAFSEKRPLRVGQRMASQMLSEIQRFKGIPHDSALVLLIRQSKHHTIVLSQCDFELRFSRQNESPAWQALSDSVILDTRRVVIRKERLSVTEINDVLNRAARMAQFCMAAGVDW